MGGEGAHGVLALSPRAIQRLESYSPPWPMPKLFRLTSGGKCSEAIFKGDTINTPSLLCVEDAIDGLRWGESIGGLKALMARSEANLGVLEKFVAERPWISFSRPTRLSAQHLGVPHITARGSQHLPPTSRPRPPRRWPTSWRARSGLRRRLLPRRPAGTAHLVRRHGGQSDSKRCCPGSTGRTARSSGNSARLLHDFLPFAESAKGRCPRSGRRGHRHHDGTHDPSVGVRRRHLPSFAGEEDDLME